MALTGENLSTGDCLRGTLFITSLKWSGLGFEPELLVESDGAEDNAEDRVLRGHRDRPIGIFINKLYVTEFCVRMTVHRNRVKLIKPTDALNSNFIGITTLHVSGSLSAHHQEF